MAKKKVKDLLDAIAPSATEESDAREAIAAEEDEEKDWDDLTGREAYIVKAGDTLGGIAKDLYGSVADYKRLAAENAMDDPNALEPGQRIYYRPAPPELQVEESEVKEWKPGREPDSKDLDIDYETFRKTLSGTESSNDASAKNPKSTARGLYQFTKAWDWLAEKVTDGAKKTVKELDAAEQHKMFAKYFEDHIVPMASRLKKNYERAEGYSDDELGLMVHFAGAGGAQEFLRTGKDPKTTRKGNPYGNPTIDEYVEKWRARYPQEEEKEQSTNPLLEWF